VVKDSFAETCFEDGWENVERHFRRLSQAATDLEKHTGSGLRKEEIADALEKLSSQVELFADHWIHFHCRVDALLREHDLKKKE
jgi:redox-regulated HSP33 family molecular chaperone